nr:ABC transporter B family member 4-like [Tanacetum cinerariifolium]
MLMFADTVGAAVNQVCMPLLYGDLIDSFGDNENNNDVVNAVSKVSLKFVHMPVVAGVAAFLHRKMKRYTFGPGQNGVISHGQTNIVPGDVAAAAQSAALDMLSSHEKMIEPV